MKYPYQGWSRRSSEAIERSEVGHHLLNTVQCRNEYGTLHFRWDKSELLAVQRFLDITYELNELMPQRFDIISIHGSRRFARSFLRPSRPSIKLSFKKMKTERTLGNGSSPDYAILFNRDYSRLETNYKLFMLIHYYLLELFGFVTLTAYPIFGRGEYRTIEAYSLFPQSPRYLPLSDNPFLYTPLGQLIILHLLAGKNSFGYDRGQIGMEVGDILKPEDLCCLPFSEFREVIINIFNLNLLEDEFSTLILPREGRNIGARQFVSLDQREIVHSNEVFAGKDTFFIPGDGDVFSYLEFKKEKPNALRFIEDFPKSEEKWILSHRSLLWPSP